MAVSLGPNGDEDGALADINTTPLVDVMLVLLIIFMVAMPAALHAPPVALPDETARAAADQPSGVVITIEQDGRLWWNDDLLADPPSLDARLRALVQNSPAPAIRLRADADARFAAVNQVVGACRRAGIAALDFATQPRAKP